MQHLQQVLQLISKFVNCMTMIVMTARKNDTQASTRLYNSELTGFSLLTISIAFQKFNGMVLLQALSLIIVSTLSHSKLSHIQTLELYNDAMIRKI